VPIANFRPGCAPTTRPWIWWALAGGLLLYPLGLGPANNWCFHAKDEADLKWRCETVDTVYAPLYWIGDHCAPLDNALGWYLAKFDGPERWRPPIP
jgi:hypothetical protein